MDGVSRNERFDTIVFARAVLLLSLGFSISTKSAVAQGAETAPSTAIAYIDLPTGIELGDFVEAWPDLGQYVVRIRAGGREVAKAELRRIAEAGSPSDGALNLLSQLEREDGNLDEAGSLVNRAIKLDPRQHRHYFQRAMISFARLAKASGLGRWTWHRRTRDDYQRAFDLDPHPIPYRYYLTYSLAQTPRIGGGDKDRALHLAEDGVAMGQRVFYVVRGDVHRLRGENASAFADYDRSVTDRVFKLSSFLAAGALALGEGDHSRARRYLDWAVSCRPNDSRTHEGLGDYYAAVGDSSSAVAAYRETIRLDPRSSTARTKLAKLGA